MLDIYDIESKVGDLISPKELSADIGTFEILYVDKWNMILYPKDELSITFVKKYHGNRLRSIPKFFSKFEIVNAA